MTGESGWRVRPAVAVVAAVLLMIAGAAAAALFMRGHPASNGAGIGGRRRSINTTISVVAGDTSAHCRIRIVRSRQRRPPT